MGYCSRLRMILVVVFLCCSMQVWGEDPADSLALVTGQYRNTEKTGSELEQQMRSARARLDSLSLIIDQLKGAQDKKNSVLTHTTLDKKLKEAQEMALYLDGLSTRQRANQDILQGMRVNVLRLLDGKIAAKNQKMQNVNTEKDKLELLREIESLQKQRSLYESKVSDDKTAVVISAPKESTATAATMEECAEKLEKVRFILEKRKKEAADLGRQVKNAEDQITLLEKTITFVARTEGLESEEKGYLKTREEYESELSFLKGRLVDLKEQGQAADKEIKKLQEQEAALCKQSAAFNK